MISFLQNWFKLGRIVPLVTALAAGLALAGSMIGLIQLSLAEGIIIALLALLTIDTLTERVGILESIEDKLSKIDVPPKLLTKSGLPTVEDQAKTASVITIVGVSSTPLVAGHIDFFEKKIREGCTIQALLLMPNSPTLEHLNKRNNMQTEASAIERTLHMLGQLNQAPDKRGKCEIRLSEGFLPFSSFATDIETRSGSIVIAFHNYKTSIDRPNLMIYGDSDPLWYDFFAQQLKSAWDDGISYEQWRSSQDTSLEQGGRSGIH